MYLSRDVLTWETGTEEDRTLLLFSKFLIVTHLSRLDIDRCSWFSRIAYRRQVNDDDHRITSDLNNRNERITVFTLNSISWNNWLRYRDTQYVHRLFLRARQFSKPERKWRLTFALASILITSKNWIVESQLTILRAHSITLFPFWI